MKKLGKYLDERSLPRLGVLLCFSAVFMLFASPYTTPLNAYYGYDSAVFMSFGKGITHGLRLYLDLYDNKGPMIFYFNALGYLLGGRMLVNIFMNEPSEAAMASGVQFLRIVSPFYFVVSCKLVSDGVLRGAGLMKEFMAATFTDLILRVGLAIVLSKALGVIGVWCAWPIGWSIAMVLSVIFYRRGPWEKA